ncbi:MAG TPA: glucose-6-phosphate dehydrogenase, partial [Myxococcota bacterium]|nr:glucose-6-phosphate dehydrogenase [Myxococcota bacterium]
HEINRIDHYLGKELVRNIMVLRFANPLFERAWDRHGVDHVQVTLAETLGVGDRAGYYESVGAVRDMLQNHMLQVLALAAMERPASLAADAVRDAMVRAIEALAPAAPADVVLGQYGAGEVGGERVRAYRDEDGVDPRSATDTFAAVRARIDHPRWEGVPFLLRTGKRLGKQFAEANVVLRGGGGLFGGAGAAPNVISIRIQPHEGISVACNVKAPGEELRLEPVVMDHCHNCLYGIDTPGAYEVLLQDFLEGDATLFARWDFVRASWAFVDPIARLAGARAAGFPNYAAGTFGPDAAEALPGQRRRWIVSRDILG